jgi:aryl-alcohol dehydrogenase-like predicted oxidoreductase
MKISRKQFLKNTLLTTLGIGFIPKLFGMIAQPKSSLSLRKLGNTGIEVTSLGFGASRTQEPSVLKAAINNGITFLDTGRSYAHGENEIMIGNVLKGIREQFVIQSKMKVDLENGSASPDQIRDQMESSLNKSLKALQTDYIDIILLHGIRDKDYLNNETIKKVFREMKKRGLIRACGFSSHTNHVSLLKVANKDHFFDVIMVPFNPFGGFKHSLSDWSTSWDQEVLIAEMKKAHEHGTGIVAMKTCSGGKYAFRNETQPTFPGAVQWVLSHDFVDTTAVAMANFDQIDAHVKAEKKK